MDLFSPLPRAFEREVVDAVGPRHVVYDVDVASGHASDWTGRFTAVPVPVVRPGNSAEVTAVVQAARAHAVALVPQGGNTGLVGGGVPMDGGVVVDLRRLDDVYDVDCQGGQLSAGAGATIASVQSAARRAGWAYGVDWSARDSATIGGSVATDAGGLRFLRHGSTRRQLMGIEAVLGTGDVISHLPAVEKDNTGYDLAAVLCGSEGTLGLITTVRVRLVREPAERACALVGFLSVHDAVDAAALLRREVTDLDAVELMIESGIELVCDTMGLARPFADPVAAMLLVEVAGNAAATTLARTVEELAGVSATAVAPDATRRHALWQYREAHTEAIGRVSPPHKLDVTLPIGALGAFIDDVPQIVASVAPQARTWLFGHAGDGNVHVNVTGLDPDDDTVDHAVLSAVVERHGSISAEHGIGRAKRRWMHLAHTAGDIEAMRLLKAAWDPEGICNPGVLI